MTVAIAHIAASHDKTLACGHSQLASPYIFLPHCGESASAFADFSLEMSFDSMPLLSIKGAVVDLPRFVRAEPTIRHHQ